MSVTTEVVVLITTIDPERIRITDQEVDLITVGLITIEEEYLLIITEEQDRLTIQTEYGLRIMALIDLDPVHQTEIAPDHTEEVLVTGVTLAPEAAEVQGLIEAVGDLVEVVDPDPVEAAVVEAEEEDVRSC